jgi:hypothetical protein
MNDHRPDDWTCAVCTAAHTIPSECCRRCGAALLPFARIRIAARALRRDGQWNQAAALYGGAEGTVVDLVHPQR